MAKKVRAKFYCESVTHFAGEMVVAKLRPVVGKGENWEFWKATPGGEIGLSITNPATATFFRPGQEYYVDFLEAEASMEQVS